MDKNLSWTSSLGDAYANQQQAVTDAVQAMRQQARKAGQLNSNEQGECNDSRQHDCHSTATQMLFTCPPTTVLVIRRSDRRLPRVGSVPGIFMAAHQFTLAVVLESASSADFGWGWHHWDYDWHRRAAIYNHNTYISHSRTIINRNNSITTAAILTMATRSTGADLEAEIQDSMGLHLLTLSRVHVPARSVALITAEMSEAFPPAGSLALEAAPMEVDFTGVGPTVVGA